MDKNLIVDGTISANDYYLGGQSLSRKFSDISGRVDKVGAGAAALAGLHPLDYDSDAKWDITAGYGNYKGTNAVALGAFYRPNENTMFNLAGTINGEKMFSAGVSFKVGQGTAGRSRTELAKQVQQDQVIIQQLVQEMAGMKKALHALVGMVDLNNIKSLPDVPKNHWAKEAVDHLAGNNIMQG